MNIHSITDSSTQYYIELDALISAEVASIACACEADEASYSMMRFNQLSGEDMA
jgi:hypothetical protein